MPALFLYFLYKTFLLQISSYTDYEIASLENKTREVLIQPRRGVIYDRNGNILVNNVPSFNLIINPSLIENIDDHLNEINQIIDLTEDEENYAKENFSRLAKLNRELVLKKIFQLMKDLGLKLENINFQIHLSMKDIPGKIYILSFFHTHLDIQEIQKNLILKKYF